MKKLVVAAAFFATVSPALAELPAATEHVLVSEGRTLRYTVRSYSDYRLISGSDSDGTTFELREKKGWVRGRYGISGVSFPSPRQPDQVEVARR